MDLHVYLHLADDVGMSAKLDRLLDQSNATLDRLDRLATTVDKLLAALPKITGISVTHESPSP